MEGDSSSPIRGEKSKPKATLHKSNSDQDLESLKNKGKTPGTALRSGSALSSSSSRGSIKGDHTHPLFDTSPKTVPTRGAQVDPLTGKIASSFLADIENDAKNPSLSPSRAASTKGGESSFSAFGAPTPNRSGFTKLVQPTPVYYTQQQVDELRRTAEEITLDVVKNLTSYGNLGLNAQAEAQILQRGSRYGGLTGIFRPLARAAEIGMYPERYNSSLKQAAKERLRELTMPEAISNAVREQFQLQEINDELELEEPVKTLTWSHTSPRVNEEVDAAHKSLKKDFQKKFSDASDLEVFLDQFIDTVNEKGIPEKRAKTLFLSFFENSMHYRVKNDLRQGSLQDTIDKLRVYKCMHRSAEKAQVQLATWSLNFNKMRECLWELDTLLTSAYPGMSRQEKYRAIKLQVKSRLPKVVLVDLGKEETFYKQRHMTNDMRYEKWVELVETLLLKHGKTGNVRAVKEGNADDASRTKVKAVVAQQSVGKELSEFGEGLRKTLGELTDQIKAVHINPNPTQVTQGPRAFYNAKTMYPRPGQSGQSGHTQVPQNYFNNDKRNSSSQNEDGERFIMANSPDMRQVGQRIHAIIKYLGRIQTPQEKGGRVKFTWQGGKYIPERNLWYFRDDRPIIKVNKQGKYMATQALEEHFSRRCTSCGIEGHKSDDKFLCPIYGDSDSFDLCADCRTGFHQECKLHPDHNPYRRFKGKERR